MNENKKLMSGIKSKLIAAVCMLLVAVIMVVSSTYAWFTLSTAPEVTGITTAVGANGALEMVLVKYENGTAVHHNGIHGSTDQSVINNYWGNLVDVSDNTKYGLNQITLYPSKLNLDTNGNFSNTVLETPKYGDDGRVSSLEKNGVIGEFIKDTDADLGAFYPSNALNSNGVRAVGVASGMTDRQLAYRNALAAANTATSTAKNKASLSLNANGSILADIAIKKAMNSGNYSPADVAALKNIVTSLLTDVIPQVETAYEQYILAYAASQGFEDSVYQAVNGLINAQDATLYTVINGLVGAGVTLNTDITNSINALKNTRTTVEEANAILTTMLDYNDILWEDSGTDPKIYGISTPLYMLANVDAMKVNGKTPAQIKDDIGGFASTVMNGKGILVEMASGGGVYADVADHCGDYSASVVISEVEYNSVKLENIDSKMQTSTSGAGKPYLNVAKSAVEAKGSPSGGAAGTMPITEFYGYIIDLGFRTNAAESNLLLQATPTDRIYSDNDTSASTYGGGSSMTFESTAVGFTNANVKELMKSIRIVFFTPGVSENKVLAYAKLDTVNATEGADGVTAMIQLYKESSYYAITVVVDGTTYDKVYTKDNKYYTDFDCTNEITLQEAIPADQALLKEHKVITETKDSIITSLSQNVVETVSVLVYLDGETITNAKVAATAATSMKGSMNLQFASSATLVPMDYANLHQPAADNGGSGSGTQG